MGAVLVMKRNVFIGLLVALTLPHAHAVTVNQAITWMPDDTAGWWLDDAKGDEGAGSSSIRVVDGALEWRIPEDAGEHIRFRVIADASASSGALAGDYFDVAAMSLSFEFYAAVDTLMEVELWSESRFFFHVARLPVQAGWQKIRVPLNTNCFGAGDFSAPHDLKALMSDIDTLTIGVYRGDGEGEQSYRILNLMLVGARPGYAAWVQPFVDHYGGGTDQWLPAADRDGNGMPNGSEYVAGTNPAVADDVLFVRSDESFTHLRWHSVAGRIYSLWRTTCPRSGFGEKLTEISGTGEEIIYPLSEVGMHARALFRLSVRFDEP